MTSDFTYKICFALSVVMCVGTTCLADSDAENRSKYKYGYVIEHKGGSTQAHLESRDGNLALGRYYVNLQNGTGQKVTYFADDLGFHTGVSYSSQNGQGSSKTQIAMGQKAVAAFGNSETQQNSPVTASSPTLFFGKKILKVGIDAVTPKPTGIPELNYTPVPGGFYLTHKSVGKSNDTTEHPSYIADLTSQGFSSDERKQSVVVPQGNINTQTFYSEPHDPSNEVNQFQVQFTTPSIKTYTQQGTGFSGTTQFSPKDQTVKISTYTANYNNLSYSKQKSIEKTKFGDIDAQILSEVQKHAEHIIMKDLQKSQNANSNFAGFSSAAYRPSSPVTMQPIIVTSDGETGLNNIISTTEIPEIVKSSKNLQSGTINSVKTAEKNSDQALGDSGYFRVSLSPSLVSSINVSQTPHQSINAESTDQSPVSNNSMLFEFNLCKKDCQLDLNEAKAKKETDQIPDISDGSGTNKIVQTFYPENKLHDERHYITTIDVQKSISLDVNQNEAGYIQLAQNYPINKIQPFNQIQKQYNSNPTPQPIISKLVSVTPASTGPESNLISAPKQPYILNTVTVAPGLFDVTPNQNLAVLQGLNDISSSQIQYSPPLQDRTGISHLGYENQLVVPPPPVRLTNDAADDFPQKQDDLIQVEKSIQELRQQILANIDAQHEDEQRKQNLVDEERKQYFESLKKVEALKDQKYYEASVTPQVVQTTASPTFTGNVENVEIVPQAQYPSAPDAQYETAQQNEYPTAPQATYKQAPHIAPQAQYAPTAQAQYVPPAQTYQTEIKDFTHEVAVPQPPNVPEISNVETYQKQVLQAVAGPQQYTFYDNQNPLAVDNNIQQSAQTYTTEKVQLSNYVPQSPIAFQPRFILPQVTEKPKIVPQFVHEVPAAPPAKIPNGKTFLVNPVVPVEYSRFLQLKQPVPLLQTYPVPLASESKIAEIYPVSQQITFPIQLPQAYKFLTYPDVVSDKYHATLTQTQNKLRVQPLKPSSPDENSQREAVQNLLSQPQFHQTYYYPGLPSNSNRLQLRHIRKHQISNSDQVRSQSVTRRGKSLKNLRIEYGFKPPLRPSVEFSEEVKPSIYGPSVQPQ